MAARTRSRLSRTAVSARPTTENCGSPAPQNTSTRTVGASSPNCARVWTVARFTRNRRVWLALPALDRGDALLEFLEPLAAAPQHAGLDVEFLARHEIELRESALEHGLEVVFEVVLECGQAGRHGFGQLAREIVEGSGIECHGVAPASRKHHERARRRQPCAEMVQAGRACLLTSVVSH